MHDNSSPSCNHEDRSSRICYAIGGFTVGMGMQVLVALVIASSISGKSQAGAACLCELLAYVLAPFVALVASRSVQGNLWPWLNHPLAVLFNLLLAGGLCCVSLFLLLATAMAGYC